MDIGLCDKHKGVDMNNKNVDSTVAHRCQMEINIV